MFYLLEKKFQKIKLNMLFVSESTCYDLTHNLRQEFKSKSFF